MMVTSFIVSLRILVPYFMKVLRQMRVEPPFITAKMFELNVFLTKHGGLLLIGINALLMLVAVLASNKKTGYYLERIIVKASYLRATLHIFYEHLSSSDSNALN